MRNSGSTVKMKRVGFLSRCYQYNIEGGKYREWKETIRKHLQEICISVRNRKNSARYWIFGEVL